MVQTHPNTKLFLNIWVPWAQAHPVPETPPASWLNQCGKQVFEAVKDTVGWHTAPRVTGPTAAAVAAASGWLNPNAAAAPIGAFHFWGGGAGHTAWDLIGGGEVCSMATSYQLIWGLQKYLGVQSVAGYKGPYRYLGWATNYGGGTIAYTEPPATPVPVVLTATQRQTTAITNGRTSDNTAGTVAVKLPAHTVEDMRGFTHGQVVTQAGITSDLWYVSTGDVYFWAGAFTEQSEHDLTDLDAPAPVNPAPVPVDTLPPVAPAPEPVTPAPDPEPATGPVPPAQPATPAAPGSVWAGVIAAIVKFFQWFGHSK